MFIKEKKMLILFLVLLISLPMVYSVEIMIPSPPAPSCTTKCFWNNGTAQSGGSVNIYVDTNDAFTAACTCLKDNAGKLIKKGNAIFKFYLKNPSGLVSQASAPINATGDAYVTLSRGFDTAGEYYFDAENDPVQNPAFRFSSGSSSHELLYVLSPTGGGPEPDVPIEEPGVGAGPIGPGPCGSSDDDWGCSLNRDLCERLNPISGAYESVDCAGGDSYCTIAGSDVSCYPKLNDGESCSDDFECLSGDCGGGLCVGVDTDRDGIPDSADADIDGDGIPNNVDTDIDGDGILNDEDPSPYGGAGRSVGTEGNGVSSCSSAGGMICSSGCAPGSELVDTVDFPCCVPASCRMDIPTPVGVFVTISTCRDTDLDGVDELLEFTCAEEFVADCENNLITVDQAVLAGVESPFRVAGSCLAEPSDGTNTPLFGLDAIILALVVLMIFYIFNNRKALKKKH